MKNSYPEFQKNSQNTVVKKINKPFNQKISKRHELYCTRGLTGGK